MANTTNESIAVVNALSAGIIALTHLIEAADKFRAAQAADPAVADSALNQALAGLDSALARSQELNQARR